MKTIILHDEKKNTVFAVEADSRSGLKKVASKVLGDYNQITGSENQLTEIAVNYDFKLPTVFAGIAGESKVLESLEAAGKIDLSKIKGKWEVYKMTLVDNSVVIAGSDLLGTIYGLFTLSEKMGVSPLKYWADSVVPLKKELEVKIDEEASKEPSVKFRGFFINDEWPCYGNWTMEHFGGFTAEMYDHVFELLLRCKGNYLWPAMWSSSFALDGPGLKSYELASEYGIFIGNSHHEPCLRAGEEYSKVRGKGSIYGDAWNYHANTEGITRFWKDSLDERGGFESVVTVGMRGEADSTILGANATLKDNIDLLKDVIHCQQQLIKETETKFNKTFPKVLALYKEVEPFYYGDANTEGLCEWDELKDVILMLCEDNHGYLRTVPDEKMRKHPAGFGMYYHVDYHGDPISYEWINSSPLNVMWEQMSQAYEYGIRSIWILNVGDLKHNEFPLTYFLNLAYDFDKYGSSAPNTTFEYTLDAIAKHFGNTLSKEQVQTAAEILTETVRINGYRRPEALNENIYSACHFGEADALLERLDALEAKNQAFEKTLDKDAFKAWYSLTGFQTRAAIALIRMHLYGGKNVLLAKQGLKTANDYAKLVTKQIKADKDLKAEFADFNDHKWRGHELASHVGFTKWNEDGSRYPLRMEVEPFDRPRLYVSRTDDEKIYDKVYGPCMRMKVNDFMYEDNTEVKLKLSNMGIGSLKVKVTVPENNWLKADITEAEVFADTIVTFSVDKSKLTEKTETVLVTIFDGDTKVEAEFNGRNIKKLADKDTFLPSVFGYSMLAKNYAEKSTPAGFEWTELKDYGVFGSAMKVFPVIGSYEKGNEPYLTYKVYVEDEGEYTLEVDFAQTNPLSRENKLMYAVNVNGKASGEYNTVPAGYRAGVAADKDWSIGTLDHRRRCESPVLLTKGVNEVKLSLLDNGLVPMKLYLYKNTPPKAYFGMPESAKGVN